MRYGGDAVERGTAWQFAFAWLPVGVLLAAIVFVDVWNRKPPVVEALNRDALDKLVHAGAYGALGLLVGRALARTCGRFVPIAGLAGATAVSVGAFSGWAECLQARTLAGHDALPHLLADWVGLGAAVVALVAVWSSARRAARRRWVSHAARSAERGIEARQGAEHPPGRPRMPG